MWGVIFGTLAVMFLCFLGFVCFVGAIFHFFDTLFSSNSND